MSETETGELHSLRVSVINHQLYHVKTSLAIAYIFFVLLSVLFNEHFVTHFKLNFVLCINQN